LDALEHAECWLIAKDFYGERTFAFFDLVLNDSLKESEEA
jgi:hypothetical protein